MRAKEDGRAGQHADALAVTNGRRMTISIVANRAESAREDVTKIAPDEFGPGNRFGFELVVGAILPKKGDGAAGDRNDPAVRNHTAGDVVAKIANGMGAGTGRLNVNAPVFGPNGGINLPIRMLGFAASCAPAVPSRSSRTMGKKTFPLQRCAWYLDACRQFCVSGHSGFIFIPTRATSLHISMFEHLTETANSGLNHRFCSQVIGA